LIDFEEDKTTAHEGTTTERNTMAANQQIVDYTNAVKTAFTTIGGSVDEIVASVNGVAGDVAALKAKIDKLQNNPGVLSAEDQALLDESQALANGLSTKIAAVKAQVKTLDDSTAPDEVPTPPVA
jgi:outer membrane murein-binding lipoprotein Lpp